MSSVAAEVGEESTPSPPPKRRGKRTLILMAAAGVLALGLAIGGGLWFTGLLSHRKPGDAGAQANRPTVAPTLVDVPDIVTNLDSGSRRAVFLRMKARIEVGQPTEAAVITADMPRILDAFETYLRSMRPEEFHGGEGIYRLREAMMNRIDVIAAPVQVLDVLFPELLIQ